MLRKPAFARNESQVHCFSDDEKSSDVTLIRQKKPDSTEMPEKFGAYELVWEIRRDALSITYAARNVSIEKLLALRVFSERVTDAAQVRNILRAAGKASELTHANLVSVYENGVGENGAPYLVTDLVEGETLTEVLEVSKRLDIGRFLDIFNQSCDALIEAHSHQLIHGNLSPNKIIFELNDFETDKVKIIDFGMPPDPVQNAFYLSPEQRLNTQNSDARVDIYALGCIMYEALVGTPLSVAHAMSHTSLNFLHELASHYSPESPEHNALKLLDCIIIKCLQQNPHKRFRNVRELVDALRLVNECICGGNTRKLPARAEKLLLFRFLDCFDRKIVLCIFAYMLLAGMSVKFIGETQLQKYIDEAQLAKRAKLPLAQEYWHAAIEQAESIGKPPGLVADLHWELADTLASQSRDEFGHSVNDNLAKDAIAEYELARQYFSHGLRYRSYSLDLLENISQTWMSLNTDDANKIYRDQVLQQAKQLLKSRNFEQCAKLCSEFLRHATDTQIAYCASSAYNELGTTLPAEKGLICFERAIYYVHMAEANDSTESDNLNTCMKTLGLEPDSLVDHQTLARKALERGDAEGCSAHLMFMPDYNNSVNDLRQSIAGYHVLEQSTYNKAPYDPNMKMAIAPLLQALKIEEQSYGLHSMALGPTLISLADCYQNAGQDNDAMAIYERIFSLIPKKVHIPIWIGMSTFHAPSKFEIKCESPETLLSFVDLLSKHGRSKQARQLLEKKLLINGLYQIRDPLFTRLLKAYADQKSAQGHYAATAALRTDAFVGDNVEVLPSVELSSREN